MNPDCIFIRIELHFRRLKIEHYRDKDESSASYPIEVNASHLKCKMYEARFGVFVSD